MLDQSDKVNCIKDAVDLAWLGASTNQEARDAMLEIMRSDANIRDMMIEPHLGRIAMEAVAKSKQSHRAAIWGRPTAPDNRVEYLAKANSRTLFDIRLPCGKRLGDAMRDDLSEAIVSYRTLQKSNGEKADFYTKVLGKVKGDKRVVDVWTPAELEELKETVKE